MSVLLQPGQRQGEQLQQRAGAAARHSPAAHGRFSSVLPAQVNQQRQKLQQLQSLVDKLSSGEDSVSDQAFEDRLREAEKAILELLEEAQSSKGEAGSAWVGAQEPRHSHLGVCALQMWTELWWSA